MPWTLWLTDIRKAALIASVTATLSVLMPAWYAVRTVLLIESNHSWTILLIPLIWCFTAILPVFYLALYRNEDLPEFPKSLRVLSLAAAIVLGVETVAGLPRWIGSLGSYWTAIRMLDWRPGAVTILDAVREPGTSVQLGALLNMLSTLAYIGLLIAFSREERTASSEDIPVSRLLAVTTKIAVIGWGLFVAGSLVRLMFMPYVYHEIRDLAIQIGRTPPGAGNLIMDAVRTLLVQACLFTAPYVVYRSLLRRPAPAEHATAPP